MKSSVSPTCTHTHTHTVTPSLNYFFKVLEQFIISAASTRRTGGWTDREVVRLTKQHVYARVVPRGGDKAMQIYRPQTWPLQDRGQLARLTGGQMAAQTGGPKNGQRNGQTEG